MEETGSLGISATRANIIEKPFPAFHMGRWGKGLVPTSKGIQMVGLTPEELCSVIFIAQWECRLGEITQGWEQERAFVDKMRQSAARLVAQTRASDAVCRCDN